MKLTKYFNERGWLLAVLFSVALLPLQAKKGNPKDSTVTTYDDWQNQDLKKDHVLGTSVDKVYHKLLKNKKPQKKIIVAVIDAGVDIHHEDLAGKIWTNEDEIPGNGIDDDHNGYVDDVHGWNFLGNADGEDINEANYEFVRIIRQYKPLFQEVSSAEEVADTLRSKYAVYKKCKDEYTLQLAKSQQQQKQLQQFGPLYDQIVQTLKKYLGKDEITPEDVENIDSKNDTIIKAVNFMKLLYARGFNNDQYEDWQKNIKANLDYYLNLDFNPRTIIGDDITKLDHHGNNDVIGPDAFHGTAVSGLIAADRDNGLGINGIAADVEIMPVRTVPDGDEYDKDVALAIMYAVDNGANILNMSFGKNYSPQKYLVDKALAYAAQKNVLIVHAAGNEASDNDTVQHYPIPIYNNNTIQNWIEVGANDRKKGKNMVADFSNYGSETVDLFAPGVNVVSTFPGNKYKPTSGTSFSSPIVAGVAALVWSYYPNLTALDLKDILKRSVAKYKHKKVYMPHEDSEPAKTRFGKLSETGGVVNAYKALKLAAKVSKEKGVKS